MANNSWNPIDPNLTPWNIKNWVSVFGVIGNLIPKTATDLNNGLLASISKKILLSNETLSSWYNHLFAFSTSNYLRFFFREWSSYNFNIYAINKTNWTQVNNFDIAWIWASLDWMKTDSTNRVFIFNTQWPTWRYFYLNDTNWTVSTWAIQSSTIPSWAWVWSSITYAWKTLTSQYDAASSSAAAYVQIS